MARDRKKKGELARRFPKLVALGLTNGEFARIAEIARCVEWMVAMGIPLPATDAAKDALYSAYAVELRREQLKELRRRGLLSEKAYSRLIKQAGKAGWA